MSQPTEAPPSRQPNWADALDRVGALTPEQWGNLANLAKLREDDFNRLIQQAQKVPLRDQLHQKVQNATGRVHAVYVQSKERLSAMAERLQSQAGQYAQAGREWAGQQVQAGREWAGQQVQAGREWGGQQVQAGREWGGRQVDRATELGQQAVGTYQAGREWAGQQVQAGREWAGQQRDRAAELGGRAMDAGRGLRDNASRWFQTQKTRVSIASDGARATVAAMRFDRDMPQGTTTKDLTQLSQQHSRIMSGPTLESRLEAAQKVAQQLQAQVDSQTAARALGGMAPAGKAVNQGQGTETQQPTEQAATNLQKNNDNKGIGGR